MKIGIDGRLWNQTGVGRYIRALVSSLGQIDRHHTYSLFLRANEYEQVKVPNSRWHKVLADVRWHTFKEQLFMPKIYHQEKLDLLHIPYFSASIFVKLPLIVTIHDLTISDFATGMATTLPLPFYWFKRSAYKYVLTQIIHNSLLIITVSQTMKQQLVRTYSLDPKKVQVTYESGELEAGSADQINNLPEKYILYVGNAHPHKNLFNLVTAFSLLKKNQADLKLVLVGKKDYFYQRLEKQVKNEHWGEAVLFVGEVTNSQLKTWYKHAALFVFPSLSEGFGIPGLEAMSQGCPVVASDIPVFKEIYAQGAIYFDANSVTQMSQVLVDLLTDSKKRSMLIKKGSARVKQFSWLKMAQKTLRLYESCLSL